MHKCPTSNLAVAAEPNSDLAWMWLIQDTVQLTPGELAALAHHIVRTRKSLESAGRRVRFVHEAPLHLGADGSAQGPRTIG